MPCLTSTALLTEVAAAAAAAAAVGQVQQEKLDQDLQDRKGNQEAQTEEGQAF